MSDIDHEDNRRGRGHKRDYLAAAAVCVAVLVIAGDALMQLADNLDNEEPQDTQVWDAIPEEELSGQEPETEEKEETEEAAAEGFVRAADDAGEDDAADPLDVPILTGTAGTDYPAPQTDPDILFADYEDALGVLAIPALDLEYSVMWKADDNAYYLEHDKDGNESSRGCLILDGWNSPEMTDVSSIIYGHNMADQTMFGSLKRFLSDETLAAADPYVYLYTEDIVMVYRIFSYYLTTDTDAAYELPELLYAGTETEDLYTGTETEDLSGDTVSSESSASPASTVAAAMVQELYNDWYDAFVEDVTADSVFTPDPTPDFGLRPRVLLLATCHGAAHGSDRLLVHCVLEAQWERSDA